MKILYAIQGTGNGHVSRAREIVPILKKYGEVDLLLSGTQADVELGHEIKYSFTGFGFVFGRNGGVDIAATIRQLDTPRFIRDCRSLPVKDYNLVINDFEPICAWACKFKGKKTVALSHQAAYLSPKTPQIPGLHWGKQIMNHYAPSSHHIGFHFQKYDSYIHTPVIRREIRDMKTTTQNYYTVYLPAYSDELVIKHLSEFTKDRWQVFSKHSKTGYQKDHIEILPVDNERFVRSVANCKGLLTGGGFEGPAEALFMKKKVLAVPMRNQYEQLCNAFALEKMGVPVIWKESQFRGKLFSFLENDTVVQVHYPDETESIIASLVQRYADQ